MHPLTDLPKLWPDKNIKIRNHSVQTCITTKDLEIRVDTRIQSAIKVKYNKPDIYIVDKIRKEIIIVEVGITGFDNLRTVETEKKHKYDLLANHTASMYKYRSRIIPYVVTWDGVVTNYHRQYRDELNLDNRIEAYIQSRILKMTLESLTMDSRRKADTEADADREEYVGMKEPIELNGETGYQLARV